MLDFLSSLTIQKVLSYYLLNLEIEVLSIDSNTEEFPGYVNDEDRSFGPAIMLEFEDKQGESEPKCRATMVKTTKILQRNLHHTDAKASQ